MQQLDFAGQGFVTAYVHLLEIPDHLRHRLAGRGAHSYFCEDGDRRMKLRNGDESDRR